MNIQKTELPGVVLIEPRIFRDDRGYFVETWQQERYAAEAGLPERFVQDNLSSSTKGVLRGLHYQHPRGQGKLVQVIQGEIFDVAVDIRVGSPTYLKWVGMQLTSADGRQAYIPPGFAHGFQVVSDTALVMYKCTDFYVPTDESSLAWDDPDVAISWPVDSPILSPKDADAPRAKDIAPGRVPRFTS
ncbi:dTDP-4-dehydrorhamnose 3,5-epimerase [Isosphaeraceae bacterium EP7]